MDNSKKDSIEMREILDSDDEYKTVEYISKDSIESVHSALKSVIGENSNSFEIRLKIIHAMASKAPRPLLRLEEISYLTQIPIQQLSNHLQALREGDILDNKGGQLWRLTVKGRRLIDNLIILLFEHSGDFDEIDIIKASITHLSDLAKEYGLDLKLNSRILRFFDYILSELEDQEISLLDPLSAKKVRQMLKKAENFYDYLRTILYKNKEILSRDIWVLLDRLAKRHILVGQLITKLNQHISKLGAHIDIQEALNYFLENLTPKQASTTCESSSRLSLLNIYPKLQEEYLKNRFIQVKNKKSENVTILPDFNQLPVQQPGRGVLEDDYQENIALILSTIDEKSKLGYISICDLINLNNWEESAPKLMDISYLASEGFLELKNIKDEDIEKQGIKKIRNAEVYKIVKSRRS